jgi:uncharacterized protein
MRTMLTALIVGMLFGAGLVLSDMINPGRVLAFLDVAGRWDPTLAFVMAGSLVPTAAAFALRPQLRKPVFGTGFFIPENRSTDRRLLLGAGIFGLGWGLVGFCPGPAIAALSFNLWQPWLFVAAMLAGMAIERALPLRLVSRNATGELG